LQPARRRCKDRPRRLLLFVAFRAIRHHEIESVLRPLFHHQQQTRGDTQQVGGRIVGLVAEYAFTAGG
jgi:hypothetical protein